MRAYRSFAVAVLVAAAAGCGQPTERAGAAPNVSQAEDPFLWLEDCLLYTSDAADE